MRILTLCCEFPPVGGGAATACAILAEALAAKGHEVDVVTAGMDDLPRIETRAGVRIERVRGLRRKAHHSSVFEQASFVWPMYARALEMMRERDYDIIHAHFVVPTGLVAARLSAQSGVPFVVTTHGSDVPGYNPERFQLAHRLIHPLWRWVVSRAAAITSPSRFLAELICTHLPRPVELVANPHPAGPLPLSVRCNRVLVVSRLVERKGVHHLIEALATQSAPWELVVAGDGPALPALRRQAEQLGVNAAFLGFLPHDRLRELYASSAIFVLPSAQENFPMVLLEAMAAGCAVITTAGTGCAEVTGDAALLVRPGDVDGLRHALDRLSADPALRAAYAGHARRQVMRFSAGAVAGRFERLFERCRARPAPVPAPKRAAITQLPAR